MRKLSTFFEKSKRKPFKYGSTSLQVEATKAKDAKEEELENVLNAYEEDTSEWAVPESSLPLDDGGLDALGAAPHKVGMVDASSLKREEVAKPIEWKTLQEMSEETIAEEGDEGDNDGSNAEQQQQAPVKRAFRPSILSGVYRSGFNTALPSMSNLASLRRANAVPDPDLQDAVAQAYSSIDSNLTKKKAIKQNASATSAKTEQKPPPSVPKPNSPQQRRAVPDTPNSNQTPQTNAADISTPADSTAPPPQTDEPLPAGRSNDFHISAFVNLHSVKLPYIEPDLQEIENKYLNKSKSTPLTA